MRKFNQRILDSIVESTREELAKEGVGPADTILRQSAEWLLPRHLSSKRRRQYLDEVHRLLIHQELQEAGGRYSLHRRYRERLAEGEEGAAVIRRLHTAGNFRFIGPVQLQAILERTGQQLEDDARRGMPPPDVPGRRLVTASAVVEAPRVPTIASVGIMSIAFYYAQLMEGRAWHPRADLAIAEATKQHFGLFCSASDLRAAVDQFYRDAEDHERSNTMPDEEPDGSN